MDRKQTILQIQIRIAGDTTVDHLSNRVLLMEEEEKEEQLEVQQWYRLAVVEVQ